MVQLAFIITFIVCAAAALAGLLLSNDLRKKNPGHNHVQLLLYQQIFVYLFAFYAIWGSIMAPVILSTEWLSGNMRERLTAIVVVLAIPFQLFSWWFLLRLFIDPLKLKNQIIVSTGMFAGTFTAALLITVYLFRQNILLNATIGLFCTAHLMIAVIVASLFFFKPGAQFPRKTNRLLAPLIIVVALLQALGTNIYKINVLTTLLFIATFFILNLWPVLLFWFFAEKTISAETSTTINDDTLLEKYQITKREAEIIRGICQGKTNQEIADELFISLQTVKDHTSRIYLKTALKNRTQLSNLFGNNQTL